jgi:hypothetical protein
MNAVLAKPIPNLLLYSSQGLDPDQTLAAPPRSFTWLVARPSAANRAKMPVVALHNQS